MHAVEGEKQPEQNPREKLLDLERRISERVFEREEETRGFTVGLITRSHVLLLGPKGCAKSELAQLLCGATRWDGVPEGREDYFDLSLARDSVLDELFGPVSTKGFKDDTFRRNMAYMATQAKVVLLEEVYKSNPTLLNRLLPIMNEGVHRNGCEPKKPVPLRLLVGTSNELPDDRDDNLDAFHDRFLLRYEVSYLKDPANVRKMMEKANRLEAEPPVRAAISEAELDEAKTQAARVDVSPIFDAIDQILAALADREIHPSDRRRAALVRLVKAQAYLGGREKAVRDDLSILAHALWEEPSQIKDVSSVVLAAANPQAAQAQDIFDAVSDSHENAMRIYRRAREPGTEEYEAHNDPDPEREDPVTTAGSNTQVALNNAQRRLFKLREQAEDAGASTEPIDTLLRKTKRMRGEVESKCLDLDL